MTSLVLHTHTGLGDHFITNGMVHTFAERYDKVYLVHLSMFSETMNCLYNDYSNITPVAFPDLDINLYQRDKVVALAKETNSELISIGDPYLSYPRRLVLDRDGNPTFINTAINFDRQFYELAGLHFSTRYTNCKLPQKTNRSNELLMDLTGGKKFKLVHNTSSQTTTGYPIEINFESTNEEHLLIEVKPGITNNVLDFVDLVYNAEEIHTVGSFFHSMVDCITQKTAAKLVFHNIMMKHETQVNCFWNNHRWMIIDYDRKY